MQGAAVHHHSMQEVAVISVRPTGSALGAEILGVDLSTELDADTVAKIDALWLEHEVIYFRGQHLSPENHIRFSERLGQVEVHVRTDCCKPGYPKLFIVSNIVENGKPIGAGDAGTIWHSDGCCAEKPSRGSLLYAKRVPYANGVALGDTMFSSMTLAYEALPSDMKTRLQGMKAINSYLKGYSRPRSTGAIPPLTEAQKKKVPDREIPVVRRHPLTGKPCLFVNEGYTSRIVGVSDQESAELLAWLFDHVRKPEFIYRHHWSEGDLLIWDNCSTQHCAIADYPPLLRHMERTTIVGTAGVIDAAMA
jgi:taurine dioxygenase